MSDQESQPQTHVSDSKVAPNAVAWRHIQTGSGWLFAIAGFTLINVLGLVADFGVRMLIGLGMTEFVVVNVWSAGPIGIAVAYAAALISAGVFLALGLFARRANRVAFIAGMVIYALDALLLAFYRDWLGAAFHVLGLWYLYQGLIAARGKYGPLSADDAPPIVVFGLRLGPSATAAGVNPAVGPLSYEPFTVEEPVAVQIASAPVAASAPQPVAAPVPVTYAPPAVTRRPVSVASRVVGWIMLVVGALALLATLGVIVIAFGDIFGSAEGIGELIFTVVIFIVTPFTLFGSMIATGLWLAVRREGRPVTTPAFDGPAST